jgi:hypothetical protein
MGHALFDMLNVPLRGRPENAADQFSAYMMLPLGKDEARRLVTGAAYSYKGHLQNPAVTVRIIAFSGVHGAPLQRFYNLLCTGCGAAPDLFADLVENRYCLLSVRAVAEWNSAKSTSHFSRPCCRTQIENSPKRF